MVDPFVEIMAPLVVLRERVTEVFARHGLRVVHMSVTPGESVEGPHELIVVAPLTPDGAKQEGDEAFDRVLREAAEAEVQHKADAALNDLKDNLRKPGGFLE
jgi:hypothetical protein